jgi:NTE family protein
MTMDNGDDELTFDAASPVADEPAAPEARSRTPREGVGLCLSGGGYRAMVFHLGALIRLNQLGMLRSLDRVSSVSGGSITAGLLGLRWTSLSWDASDRATNLQSLVVQPILEFSERSIDVRSVLGGLFTPGVTVSEKVVRQYDRHLFRGATLQDLPAGGTGPRFVINATSVQTGKLVRFSRPYVADYTVGRWRDPTTRLADAVAASSAFPPVLSPHRLTPKGTFDTWGRTAHYGEEFRKELVLTDGGVYDNLGLQTAWSRCATLLVSDGGGSLKASAKQPGDWARHGVRITEVIDSQVRALRKRQLIEGYRSNARGGTYWGISSDVADYGLDDPLEFEHQPASYPADVPTRLSRLDDKVRRDLVRWGYVICDTAIRTWVKPGTPKPPAVDVPG